MARQSAKNPRDPADTDPPATDPAPDGVATDDPIVEAIEEDGEPSGGNFA